ncbi:NUDIX hydrolase [Luteimicrobium sp. NPDC057192]|uniref:NUDIX hydrolase n=1 Tax=Luteimicrobium sp. NPDC057192 TaxID=3346042 RepID=UPI003627D5C4
MISGAEEAGAPRASSLGADWTVGPDGVRSRRAARVILLDDAGRALLVRGHDADQPERSWWFTVGGGIDGDETPAEAALREVREETGIVLEPAQLVGPVLTRVGIFDFFKETCRQDEVFYAAVVPHVGPDTAGWTDVERELLDELAWLTPDELRAQPLEYFPTALPDVVEQLATGWDGTVRHLGTEHDD